MPHQTVPVLAFAGTDSDQVIRRLLGTANWSVEGNQASAQLGYSVATAGDVNGDGYSDVIVGAPFYNNGQANVGLAMLYLGSPSGLSTTPAWTYAGNVAGCRFGVRVSTAGDVNGDGLSDVIIGADAYTNTAMHEGRAFVFYGTPSGLSPMPNWIAESGQDSALFGISVATAGDVNGDGFSDVIVGCPFYDLAQVNEGRIFIWYGGPGGLGLNGTPGNADWSVGGGQAGAQLGGKVASAGDVNGDGYGDVIAGAKLYDNGALQDAGRSVVFYGGPGGPSLTPSWIVDGDQADANLGASVATAGDVNGDGYSDVIVGAPYYDSRQANEGRALAYLGSPSGLSTTPVWTADGNGVEAFFGYAVNTAGDVNGDGYADIIVGAYQFTVVQGQEGRALVYQGRPQGLSSTPFWTVEGDQAGALLGFSVATAGDVNGDGFSDVVVGAIYYSNGELQEGRALAYHGAPAGPGAAAGWSYAGGQDGAELGISVASAGDVNGDGYADVIVGEELYSNGQANEGRALLFYGGPGGLSAAPGWMAESDSAGAEFGVSVASAGDVNGDGYDDIIIGAWQFTNGELHEGAVFAYYGGPNGPSATPNWQFESNQAGSLMGREARTAGDVNGDGYADVIVGNSLYSNGETNEGRVLVFHGGPNGLSPTPNWSAESNQGQAYFGRSVGTAGDVNGDGYSDIIVGAYLYDNGQTDEGAAFVWYGGPNGLGPNGTPANAAWMAESDNAGAIFGVRVGTAGDVNGDGYSDVIIAARNYSGDQSLEGAAFVWHGGPGGLGSHGTPANADWRVEGDQVNAQLGNAANTAGDVNGDGFSDVILGAWQYDDGQTDEGRAIVHLGSPDGLSPTPDWTGQSDQAGANFGWAVNSAGDVNGDGFSEIIVGAYHYDVTHPDEGAAFLYYGNGSPGKPLRPRQRRVDSPDRIAQLGSSDRNDTFRAAAIGRTPFGRGRVRLQVEAKPFGTTFDGSGLQESANWLDTGVAGTAIDQFVSGLNQGNPYHWRARLRYDLAALPLQRFSRWFTSADNGWQEADLRMPVPPPQVVAQPIGQAACAAGGPVTFSITATGATPLTYRWRKGTTPLADGGRVSGTSTALLTIAAPMTLGDSGSYDCVVTNAIGSAISQPATLAVWATGSGDVNLDGQTNAADISPFVVALFSGQASPGNCAADMNGDGKINGADVALFVDRLVP